MSADPDVYLIYANTSSFKFCVTPSRNRLERACAACADRSCAQMK
jgi:hypothetical protein